MKRTKPLAALALAAFACAPLSGLQAADLPRASAPPAPAPVMKQWEFGVTAYVWAAGVRGTVATTPPLPPVDIDVGFTDILKNLGGALMGTFEAKYGRFILFNDFIFTMINPEAGRTLDKANVSVALDSTSLVGLAAAGYRLVDGPNFIFDVFAGVRGFYMDNELSVRVTAGEFNRGDTFGVSKSWVDAVGGVRARYLFDENWFVNVIAFAGGGASKYQWDVYGGAGYAFNRNWAGFAGYRAFKVDYRDGPFIYDVLQHGPVVGIKYHW